MLWTMLGKEARLVAHPTSIVFSLLGCLVLVPAYPYSAIFLFGCLAVYTTFMNAREVGDFWYTAVLPMSRQESVLSKCMLIVSFQLGQLLLSMPFAFLRNVLKIPNNPVGLDATLAWYGFGLLVYGVFDWVFLTSFYQNGYRVGRAFLLACIPLFIMMFMMETAAHVPALSWLDGCRPDQLRMQLPVLLAGMSGYPVMLLLAYRVSAKRYEMVDL